MKFRPRQITVVLILITVMVGLSGHVAHAGLGSGIADMFGLNIGDWVTEMFALVVNLNLMVASYILAISGFLLNFSMNVTLGIKNFVDSTPAIYTVWKAIRDISGMFIIGMLLYAAIKMILGKDAKMGALIKTIVMAGILINFSFFFTGLGIDVSNIVSVQLYNAIAPANSLAKPSNGLSNKGVKSTWKDGGISDIFMNSLKVQSLYDTKNLKLNEVGKANNNSIVSAPLKIILGGVVGVIIMYTAAASFFFASIAFIARFVILLFLLAFSPIWFAAYAIPQLGEYAKKWTGLYKNQLLFMPVYLLLMYFAMNVLVSNTMFGSGFAGDVTKDAAWYSNFLVLGVNAALVIMMLNAPLMAALALGAKMPGLAKKMGADAIWKSVGGFVGRNTAGKIGYSAQKYLNKNFPVASNTLLGQVLINKTAGAAANAGWGSTGSATASAAAAKTRGQAQQAGRTINALNAAVKSGDHQAAGRILGTMSNSTIAGLDKNLLKHNLVLEHLDEGAHKAISANTNLSDQDKNDINNNRTNLLINSVANAGTGRNSAIVQKMVNNASGDTLAKLDDPNIAGGQAALMNDDLIRHLKGSHMKDMENVVSQPIRKHIGDRINLWTGFNQNQHNAHGYYTKNVHAWS